MSKTNKFSFPYLGFGLGLRSCHRDYILENKPKVDWFEIISDNYLDERKGNWEYLEKLHKQYPLVMHGVSLSIGSYDEIDLGYLKKLKALTDHINPAWISDHLCFNTAHGHYLHDLLPFPYNKDSLNNVVARIKKVQDYLSRNIILENTAMYFAYENSDIPEEEFIAEMAYKADCGILLDINNVYLSAINHGFSAEDYLDKIPSEYIVQIHLGGHLNKGNVILDNHNDHVIDEVWKLYKRKIDKIGPVSTMIEWDERIPEFPVLEAELIKAKKLVGSVK